MPQGQLGRLDREVVVFEQAPQDVADRAQVEAMVAGGIEVFSGADGVVCNAGCSLMTPISDTTDEQIREELDLQVFGAGIAVDRGIALGRFGHAAEVAPPIVSLLSPLSSHCTGTTVDVVGGVARYL